MVARRPAEPLREALEWLSTDMEYAAKRGTEDDDLDRWRMAVANIRDLSAAPMSEAWGAMLEDIIGLWATGEPDQDDVLETLSEHRPYIAALSPRAVHETEVAGGIMVTGCNPPTKHRYARIGATDVLRCCICGWEREG